MTYEFMEHCVVGGAFGMMIALCGFSIGYWVITLVKWISRKVKKHQYKSKN